MGLRARLTALLLWYQEGFVQKPLDFTEPFQGMESPIVPIKTLEGLDVIEATRYQASCNTAKNRQCWSNGFDITTDYELDVPNGTIRRVRYAFTNLPFVVSF